jgi:serine/threonine protein kinase
MSSYVQDKLTLTELATNVEKEWIEITATRGKLDQLRIYRASLNLDELSTFDLCTYHRVEMDQIDPSVCRVFDETGNDRLLLATLIPSVVMGLILGVFAYLLVRRKAIDSVWMIQLKELKFDDPPEILGRGTFGLVLLAEYRGTEVAVKRVIPRKNQMPRKTAAKDKPTLAHDKTVRFSEEKVVEKDLLMINSSSSHRSQSLAKCGLGSERKLSIFFDADVKAADEMEASEDGHAHRARRRYSYITSSPAQDVERQDQAGAVLRRNSVASKCSSTGSISENTPFNFASVNPDGPTRGESMIKPFSRDSAYPSLVKVNGLTGRESMGDVAGIMCNPKMPKSVSIWSLKKLPRLFQKDQHKILLEDFGREIRQLSTLRHPSIVSVMGAVIEKGKEPMLVLEFMHLGSLYDLLHNTTFSFEGGTILAILRDIAQGVYFLHAATPQVIHGDIKSHNILVDSRFRAKVADFGLSQVKYLRVAL